MDSCGSSTFLFLWSSGGAIFSYGLTQTIIDGVGCLGGDLKNVLVNSGSKLLYGILEVAILIDLGELVDKNIKSYWNEAEVSYS